MTAIPKWAKTKSYQISLGKGSSILDKSWDHSWSSFFAASLQVTYSQSQWLFCYVS